MQVQRPFCTQLNCHTDTPIRSMLWASVYIFLVTFVSASSYSHDVTAPMSMAATSLKVDGYSYSHIQLEYGKPMESKQNKKRKNIFPKNEHSTNSTSVTDRQHCRHLPTPPVGPEIARVPAAMTSQTRFT